MNNNEIKKALHPFDRLEEWSNKYDFQVQIYDGDYNIYVEKDGVDLYSIGGEKTLKDAVDRIIEWIERVNRKVLVTEDKEVHGE
ncbi:hypothetical protein OHD16_06835 [Sphingobacterium sp. ML3W]|uniref:hypothetical protein n=1 Tax=Sphingobacterium sp. ML3W TaxID=1538644 RepID=UPI00249C21FB|nr:hypothetical protein [Sphingobacterium sp. ML3W]WFA79685.1 hypothetical protein OGI71_27075 [Sphingobacterium sp. ML3W]